MHARRFAMVAASALLLSVAVRARPSSGAQATFRSGVDAVALYSTVTSRDGRLVEDLAEAEFRVEDNGRPVPITLFSRDRQPLGVTLVLDMSDSTLSKVFRIRDAARAFVHGLHADDRVRIGTFGSEIAISPAATGDRTVLDRVLLEELWPGGPTPLWNALDTGMTSLADEPGRRAVIALTDGDNSASLPGFSGTQASVRRRAESEDVLLYGIGLEGHALSRAMADLTDTTGGAHFDVKRDADLDATFARVANELRHQYLIGFVPAVRDNTIHRVQVSVTRPGLTVRARRSYLAASSPAGPGLPVTDAATDLTPVAHASSAGSTVLLVDATIGNTALDDVQDWLTSTDRFTHPVALAVMTRRTHWSPWTSSPAALATWLRTVRGTPSFSSEIYGPSPLWDAAHDAVAAVTSPTDTNTVVLVSDGRASGNHRASTDVAREARDGHVRVHTVIAIPPALPLAGTVMMLQHPEYIARIVSQASGGSYVERQTAGRPGPLSWVLDRLVAR